MPNNRISATLSAADKAAIITKLGEIRALLPFLVGLADDERRELARLGNKTIGYDQDCAAGMAARPDLIPGYVDQAELAKDRALWIPLGEILTEVDELGRAVRDTFDVLGSEIFDADRGFHANVRESAQRGMPGAQAIYDQIKARFPGRPRGSSNPTGGGGTPP